MVKCAGSECFFAAKCFFSMKSLLKMCGNVDSMKKREVGRTQIR